MDSRGHGERKTPDRQQGGSGDGSTTPSAAGSPGCQTTTIAELLREGASLTGDSARLDAQILLAHTLGCSRTHLFTWPEQEVPADLGARYRQLLHRRTQGEPVAHLVETQEFWSLSLQVSPATLIPRADTELLVELALALELPAAARVLDLGTGTGAIALALASERPGWSILAVDSQPDAMALARQNAQRLRFDQVEVRLSNWFQEVAGTFDLVVSNPPYIAPDDPHLQLGDVRFEPASALVASHGGYGDLAHIIDRGRHHLAPGGVLMVEHGAEQGERVRTLFAASGYLDIATHRDLGGHQRVTLGKVAS